MGSKACTEGLAVAEHRWVPLGTEMVACGSGWGQRRLWECLLIAPVVSVI